MAKSKEKKDIPLLLRRRWVEFDEDGNGVKSAMFLNDPFDRGFPPRHEFDKDWLLRNSDVAQVDGDTITLTFGDGTAVYTIDHAKNEETKATGIWANLTEEDLVDG